MSSRYYLPLPHDAIAKHLFQPHRKKNSPSATFKDNRECEFVYKVNELEYWWNISTKTITKISHNKPNVVLWNHNEKLCSIIEFICPADINFSRKIDEKMNAYCLHLRILQILYTEYKFEAIPIVVGAIGSVTKSLNTILKSAWF